MTRFRIVLASAAMTFAASAAHAQAQASYPSRVVRIVTAAPGSNNDWGARLVGDAISPSLGHRVIVENRGGLGEDAAAHLDRLYQEIVKAIHEPEVKEILFKGGVEPPGGTPRELGDYVATDITRITRRLKATAFSSKQQQ